ncbi:ABC transporter ATP-binding protein [Slackia exigua]|uniref:ABC transporter ATP-binding protein n=1 Tax=Slackia exigua TaxID=84109 RepID=UPI0028DCEB7F|nr:ABC transporter ATP-binding protein [Slackia exigua]
MIMKKLQDLFQISDAATADLGRGILACTLTNVVTLLSVLVVVLVFQEILVPLDGGEVSWERLWMLFGAGLVIMVLSYFCSRNDYRKTYVSCYTAAEDSRLRIAETVRHFPMSVFNEKSLAELTGSLMGDCANIEHALSHIVPPLVADCISMAIVCVGIAFFDWRMALAIFCTLPLALLIVIVSRRAQQRASARQVAAKAAASEKTQEYLEGIRVIKECRLGGEKASELKSALAELRDASVKMELKTGVVISVAQFVLQAGIGITVFVGARLFIGGDMELLPFLLSCAVVCRVYGPILSILTLLPMLFHTIASTKRIRELFAIPRMEGEAIEIERFDIRFDNASFSYGNDEVLSGIDLEIPERKVTAIVGPSGSGKSTLLRLIARFWDVDAGAVRIGGIDVRSVDSEHLMNYLSFVFQDVVLFDDTVMNNIRIGNSQATDEQVMVAARAACCDGFVRALPDGYDTLLGENGSTLSGGERQRISIARAMLKDSPVILLDEATAALDPASEYEVHRALSRLVAGRTVLVVAHKLSTVIDADQIIVLDRGRVDDIGTHDELMGRNGLYARLFTIQEKSRAWVA